VLTKRKAFLDELAAGLDSLGLKELIVSNPKLFEPMFVECRKITASAVKDLMKTEICHGNNPIRLQLLKSIGNFLDDCTERG